MMNIFCCLQNIIDETKSGGLNTIKYAKTPLMSSYLVAFAVGEFEYVEVSDDIIQMISTQSFFRTKQKKALLFASIQCLAKRIKQSSVSRLQFVQSNGTMIGLAYAIRYRNAISLQFLTLQWVRLMIFSFVLLIFFFLGAMENWGLVTYREVALLVDPAKSSTRHKSRIALVIAHELAHMWFGNLVTMVSHDVVE